MSQRQTFLSGEGDAWFDRNVSAVGTVDLPHGDSILVEMLKFSGTFSKPQGACVLEIGCGPGVRLGWLKENLGYSCYGIDPSAKAVEFAATRGVDARVGTAECLPYPDDFFDIVIFGFCLYLCDRSDLFRIAAEADRVLKTPGWLLIKDFYSPTPIAREYHHKAGVFSHKMDYSSLFAWHPRYVVMSHSVTDHERGDYTDNEQDWVATSVLRKRR